MKSVSVIGGGLAGCEAAYVIAESGIHVNLFEMKPGKHSPAHKTDDLCELVCSNSLRSDKLDNAVGLLKEELRRMDSCNENCGRNARSGGRCARGGSH